MSSRDEVDPMLYEPDSFENYQREREEMRQKLADMDAALYVEHELPPKLPDPLHVEYRREFPSIPDLPEVPVGDVFYEDNSEADENLVGIKPQSIVFRSHMTPEQVEAWKALARFESRCPVCETDADEWVEHQDGTRTFTHFRTDGGWMKCCTGPLAIPDGEGLSEARLMRLVTFLLDENTRLTDELKLFRENVTKGGPPAPVSPVVVTTKPDPTVYAVNGKHRSPTPPILTVGQAQKVAEKILADYTAQELAIGYTAPSSPRHGPSE